MKSKLKEKAIKLRKKGLTYSEILEEVPVAKSTLSLWLRSVGLSKKQKQKLSIKRKQNIRKGWKARRDQRIKKTNQITKLAKNEVKEINAKELWLMGIMLYWAEGSKAKGHKISQGVYFSNSDKRMIKLYLKWCKDCLQIPNNEIYFDIFIHENHKSRIDKVRSFWSKITGYPEEKFDRIYFKKHKVSTNRKNIGKSYSGLLRIRIAKSTDLNRKISGWIEGVCIRCGVV